MCFLYVLKTKPLDQELQSLVSLIHKHRFISHLQKEFVQRHELLHPIMVIAYMNHGIIMTCDALQKFWMTF